MIHKSLLSAFCLLLAFSGVLAQDAVTVRPQAPRTVWLAPAAIDRFYESFNGALVWEEDADFNGLVAALEGLYAHGLNPDHYHLSELLARMDDQRARDRLATDAWFSAAAHMIYGKLDAVSVEPDWTAARREADLPGILRRSLADNSVKDSLVALAPRQPGYWALVEELATVRALGDQPMIAVSAGATLKQEMSGDRVSALQARLAQLGLLDPAHRSGVMDATTDAAVRAFQTNEGLDSDGVVGTATLAALNRGPQARIEQLRVNLERWRWLPDELGRRHVRVNIADFSVTTWQDGEPVHTYLAIVGKLYRKTPVFSGEISHAVLNPWWETPPNISRLDKLPVFKRDPGTVERMGFQVLDRDGNMINPATIDWNAIPAGTFPYRLRQAPGDQNALGQIKIMFPNAHNVYIHDTPTRGLFAQRQRAFSSGCIRTHDIVALTEWILEESPGWNRVRIDQTLATGRETRVNLASRIPVHVLYLTAVRESFGGVRYLDDLYQRDGAVLAGLKKVPGASS